MRKNILLCLVTLFCLVLPGFAQKNPNQDRIDSLLSKISSSKDDSIKVRNLSSLVELYPDISSERLKYIEEGLEIAKKIEWKEGIGLFHYHMAWFHLFSNKRDMAIENFQKAIEFSNDLEIQAYSFGCLSNILSWEKRHDEALVYANKGVEAAEKSNSITIQTDALLFLGDAYRYANDRAKAQFYYYKVFTLLDRTDLTKPSLSKMAAYVYMTETSLDNPFGLFQYAMALKSIYDSGNAHDRRLFALSLIKMGLAYTVSVESVKIKQLQLEAEAKQEKLYIAGICLLIVTAVLLIRQNRARKKINKELEKANEMKSRFFAILNHDLRRPVAGLISYLQLKTFAPEMIAPEDAAAFEKKTIDTAKNLLHNMEDLLFWCKDQMQRFTPEYTAVSVTKLFSDTAFFFSYEERIKFKFNSSSDLKIMTDENYAKTIMRNLTSNAIAALKDTEDPIIEWSASRVKNKIILSITNNGPAISRETANVLYSEEGKKNIKEGIGLKIVRDLAKTIGCRVEVTTGKEIATGREVGTKFFLIFTYRKI